MGVLPKLMRRAVAADRRGLALPTALLGLVLISVLAIGIHSMSAVQNTSIKNRESATRALLLAEAGAAHAQAVIRDTLRMYDYTRLLVGSDNLPLTADDGVIAGYGMSAALAIPKAGKAAPGGSYAVEIVDDPADPIVNLLTDGNARVVLRCTGITSDGASASVDVIVGSMLVPGIATDGDLEISSAARLMGPCGGIHANGNMTGGGSPLVATKATATGAITVNVSPKYPAQLPLPIPDLDPLSYCSTADYTISGNFVLRSTTAPGTYCVYGNVTSSGDFGSLSSMKSISIIATGSIQISSKPFIRAEQEDGILFLAGGDLDLQGDWGGEGMLYAGGHCYISSKPTINGQVICKSKPDPVGAIDRIDKNLISGDANITFGCYSTLNNRRRVGWFQRIG
jgi:hypothetical protein